MAAPPRPDSEMGSSVGLSDAAAALWLVAYLIVIFMGVLSFALELFSQFG